ncbi:riboflavin reductase (NADPH) [Malassezia pachydermatis]|uniref:Spt20 domain-containing protein n=1 Tax=Malassezia pachydermatis TaxID=77020 RepID=A0A0N0RS30_9BASI|nr:spt20 domain-containing protein [Malassezia pachydermatis]KOS13495.1 spt20 domain-containing protein [Malassezia pachydermatis]
MLRLVSSYATSAALNIIIPCARTGGAAHFSSSASCLFTKQDPVALSEAIRRIMRTSAQPVALVSAFLPSDLGTGPSNQIHTTTLSSFTTVSLAPPLVAFSIRLPSRMADALRAGAAIPTSHHQSPTPAQIMSKKPHFLIHILSSTQGPLSDYFAKPGAPPYVVGQANQDGHPFDTHPMQLSESVEGQLIPRDAVGTLACSLVYQLDLTSSDLHGTTEFENGCIHTDEVGSMLFLAHIHHVEQGDVPPSVSDVRKPLVYWHQKYHTCNEAL